MTMIAGRLFVPKQVLVPLLLISSVACQAQSECECLGEEAKQVCFDCRCYPNHCMVADIQTCANESIGDKECTTVLPCTQFSGETGGSKRTCLCVSQEYRNETCSSPPVADSMTCIPSCPVVSTTDNHQVSTTLTKDDHSKSTTIASMHHKETTVIVVVVTATTVIFILVIITVILALYWSFRIKLLRERNRNINTEGCDRQLGHTNMETNISYSGAHTESDDPLYSVIDDYSTHQYSQPPQLLLSGKVPYHQEIDRDGAEIAVADYEERPIKQNDSKQLKEGSMPSAVDPYQEPIDALRMEKETKRR